MARRTVETSIPTIIDRNFPIEVFATRVKMLEASGVVDTIQMWDQLTSWYPRSLWTPERTAMPGSSPTTTRSPTGSR